MIVQVLVSFSWCKGTTFCKRFQILWGYEWGYHAQSLTVSAENTVGTVSIVSSVTTVGTVVAFIAAFI